MLPTSSNCKLENHDCCCSHGTNNSYEQTLDEIKFENSIFGACVYNDLNRVQKLISKIKIENLSQEINKLDSSGYTALHYAARNGNFQICKLLIDSKANINIKTRNCESTPLHRASFMCHSKIVQLLIDHNANVLVEDCDGKCALHRCIENKQRDYKETARILLRKSPILLNIKDKLEKTPLDYCPDLKNLFDV
jgi:ankyrin repeat protein